MAYSESKCITTLRELANEIGCSPMVKDYKEHDCSPSVKTLANKFGSWNEAKEAAGLEVIEHGMNNNTESAIQHMRSIPPAMKTNERGYEQVRVEIDGVRKKMYIHRLVAVAEFGFDTVASIDDIHHKNEIPWDNRPENLEPVTRKEHMQRHHSTD